MLEKPGLVAEVPPGREHHRDARAVAGLDHLVVALRAAGWMIDRKPAWMA
jgi:hypothetical protein